MMQLKSEAIIIRISISTTANIRLLPVQGDAGNLSFRALNRLTNGVKFIGYKSATATTLARYAQ